MAEAIAKEIVLQKDYLKNKNLNTIYFGGGTPSLLNESELQTLFEAINEVFTISANAEISLEANPDDLEKEKLLLLKKIGVNRLSIGVQSFHQPHLEYMNRAHNAKESLQAIQLSQNLGFENITADLIYAIPSDFHEILKNDLQSLISLEIPHISAYCLTIEEKTTFGRWLKKDRIKDVDEDFAVQQFEIVMDALERAGYEQYEISNFAQKGHYSQHNTNYWKKGEYLGVGPSAHSYNLSSRQFNVLNNVKYLQSIKQQKVPAEQEILSREDQLNEYLMTAIRTMWGVDLEKIENEFQLDFMKLNQNLLEHYMDKDFVKIEDKILKLTKKGKLLADKITSDLFITAILK